MTGILTVMAETATSSGVFDSITSDTFAPLVAELKDIIKVILPVTITLCGIRKGWSWLRSAIRGA